MPLNLATSDNIGAKLVDFSSEISGCRAANVLSGDVSKIWLTEVGLPQWICISLLDIPDKSNQVIRSIGWQCWHPYSTNPRSVTVHVSSDGSKFKAWDSFAAAQYKGTQLFCCAPISVVIYPFIAFEVTQTFGGAQTYMNRVYLYSEEIIASSSDNSKSSNAYSAIEVSRPNLSIFSDSSDRSGRKEFIYESLTIENNSKSLSLVNINNRKILEESLNLLTPDNESLASSVTAVEVDIIDHIEISSRSSKPGVLLGQLIPVDLIDAATSMTIPSSSKSSTISEPTLLSLPSNDVENNAIPCEPKIQKVLQPIFDNTLQMLLNEEILQRISILESQFEHGVQPLETSVHDSIVEATLYLDKESNHPSLLRQSICVADASDTLTSIEAEIESSLTSCTSNKLSSIISSHSVGLKAIHQNSSSAEVKTSQETSMRDEKGKGRRPSFDSKEVQVDSYEISPDLNHSSLHAPPLLDVNTDDAATFNDKLLKAVDGVELLVKEVLGQISIQKSVVASSLMIEEPSPATPFQLFSPLSSPSHLPQRNLSHQKVTQFKTSPSDEIARSLGEVNVGHGNHSKMAPSIPPTESKVSQDHIDENHFQTGTVFSKKDLSAIPSQIHHHNYLSPLAGNELVSEYFEDDESSVDIDIKDLRRNFLGRDKLVSGNAFIQNKALSDSNMISNRVGTLQNQKLNKILEDPVRISKDDVKPILNKQAHLLAAIVDLDNDQFHDHTHNIGTDSVLTVDMIYTAKLIHAKIIEREAMRENMNIMKGQRQQLQERISDLDSLSKSLRS